MTDSLRAGPETEITLHFAVRLMDGTEMDSTFDGEPATFVWGDESLLPGFENALRGLKAGDKRSVFLQAEKAFGDYNEENVQYFTRSTFAQYDELETGMVLNFADASGGELPGVISKIEDDWVYVDFNHPLAGRDLTFEVEIIRVERYAPEQPVTLN